MFDSTLADLDLSGAQALAAAWCRGFRMPDALTVDLWSDKHRHIAAGMSPVPDQWSTDRMPHLREIMQAMSFQNSCTDVTIMGAIQTSGKTEAVINMLFTVIANEPCSMLMVLPNHKQIKRFVKRFDRNVQATPLLRQALRPRSRKDSDSSELKDFEGGILYFGSAESEGDLRSITTRVVIQSECDVYPLELGDLGSPSEIADGRTTMYSDRAKRVKESSPTIESLSVINKSFLAGDQSYRYVPCPHCGAYQRLLWKGVKWPAGKPEHAYYQCEHCDGTIEEHHKANILQNGVAEWRATYPERSVRHRSFQISALYSPIGLGKTWGDLATQFTAAKGEKGKLKVFVNDRLAECWVDNDEKVDWEIVKARAESYPLRVVPRRCLLFTVGIDVQKNRWECVIAGHDRLGHITILDHQIIAGDPSDRAQWSLVEEYLKRPLTSEAGPSIRLDISLIDSGFLQHDVVNFTRQHKGDRWYATKGAGVRNKPLITKPRKVDVKHGDRMDKRGGEQYEIGLDTAKDIIYANLHADGKRDIPDRKFRFSTDLSDDFFKQLCSEVFDPHKQRYEKMPGHRNETLDCLVLCIAGTQHSNIRMDRMREADWDARERIHGQALGQTLDLLADVATSPGASAGNSPYQVPTTDDAMIALFSAGYQSSQSDP